jgi:hypothetical protein
MLCTYYSSLLLFRCLYEVRYPTLYHLFWESYFIKTNFYTVLPLLLAVLLFLVLHTIAYSSFV